MHDIASAYQLPTYRFFLGNFIQTLLLTKNIFTSYLKNLITNASLVFNIVSYFVIAIRSSHSKNFLTNEFLKN